MQLLRSPETVPENHASDRLERAERSGLKLAILCRTIALAVASAWWIATNAVSGFGLSPWAVAILSGLTSLGIVTYRLIGTRFDRWWFKYTIYAADILGVCAAFALVPLRFGAEVPQILAFRAYGIYFLFPLLAMACLSLSWRLVLWSGLVAVVGWWLAYLYAISDMPVRLSWADFPAQATLDDYKEIFLSIDFVGQGSRIAEAGSLFIATAILAIAVFRARQIFLAQLAAERDREAEREARERIERTLGRYVPEAIAQRLLVDPSALAPQERAGVVLIADIADFTHFAAQRTPSDVIMRLNDFLGDAANVISNENGIVIQFTGDGLLATFNVPIEISQPARAAFAAAIALLECARSHGFAVRIGLAEGPLAAGSIGSSNRQAFTVYGDTVNRAARLEALGKQVNASIVLDQACNAAVARDDTRSGGSHVLPGLAEVVPVWIYSAK